MTAPTTRLHMSPTVRAALNTETIAGITGASLSEKECFICHRPLSGTVHVTLLRFEGMLGVSQVVLHHEHCGPSTIVYMGAEAAPAPDLRVTMTAFCLDYRFGTDECSLPVLVAEMPGTPSLISGELGERTDVLVSGVLSKGFDLLTDLDETPPEVASWESVFLLKETLTLDFLSAPKGVPTAADQGTVTLVVTDPDGWEFYRGKVDYPRDWLNGIAERGWVPLYVGNVGGLDASVHDPATVKEMLRAAAREGRLAGADIPGEVFQPS